MAYRATGYWRRILSRHQNTRQISSSTQFKMQSSAATTSPTSSGVSLTKFKADYIPIYTLFGMMFLAVTLATINAKQELVHCPSVIVDKKKRKTVPEVDYSELILKNSDDFINKSFFRRLGQRDSQIPKPMP